MLIVNRSIYFLSLLIMLSFGWQATVIAEENTNAEDAQEAEETNIDQETVELMKQTMELMTTIEADAQVELEGETVDTLAAKLKTAANEVINAEDEAEGMAAISHYLTLKKPSVKEEKAEMLEAGFSAMKKLMEKRHPLEEE